jgi:hypothetical protein
VVRSVHEQKGLIKTNLPFFSVQGHGDVLSETETIRLSKEFLTNDKKNLLLSYSELLKWYHPSVFSGWTTQEGVDALWGNLLGL